MAATVRGKIYTFFNKDTYEYNPVSNTWSKKASIPTAKRMGSAEVIDDKIYIVEGGTDLKFHIYDPLLDNWSTGPDLPTKQLYNEGIAVNGQIYIVG